jgi:hypothetical protein
VRRCVSLAWRGRRELAFQKAFNPCWHNMGNGEVTQNKRQHGCDAARQGKVDSWPVIWVEYTALEFTNPVKLAKIESFSCRCPSQWRRFGARMSAPIPFPRPAPASLWHSRIPLLVAESQSNETFGPYPRLSNLSFAFSLVLFRKSA